MREAILKTLSTPMRPTDLLRLCDPSSTREVENALSGLLDDGSVEFGYDGLLRIHTPVGEFFGSWPGEETDAELLASLKEIR